MGVDAIDLSKPSIKHLMLVVFIIENIMLVVVLTIRYFI